MKSRHNNKIVVWAHNSHVGDARYSHLETKGIKSRDLNIGQLVKENIPDSICIGQFTYTGKVTAADDWGGIHKFKTVLPSLPNSYGDVFQSIARISKNSSFGIDLRNQIVKKLLHQPRLQR